MSITAFETVPCTGVPVAAGPLPADHARVGEQLLASGDGAWRDTHRLSARRRCSRREAPGVADGTGIVTASLRLKPSKTPHIAEMRTPNLVHARPVTGMMGAFCSPHEQFQAIAGWDC